MIRIFYNLFIKDAEDSSRVLGIVDEQLRLIDPDLHDKDVFITSIGYHQPSNISHVNTMQHYPEGGEDISLHSLWDYCQDESNNRAKVVYLHSKGSFHPNEVNNKLRRFLTEGALSRECAGLPNECDVCSSRMSPHPHPHTSGNMWLARCSYIAKLRDPYALRDGDLPSGFSHDNGCKGFGRYFFEHWVHSHPTVRPCDLYTGKEYTFAHENLPGGNFTKDLQKAPRFGFDVFISLLLKHSYYCRGDTSSLVTARDYLENRKWNYGQLYNITMLDESWYLWPFLNDSSPNLIHTS
ncbi:hypothetical protein ACHAXR_007725 [Thalassiosira sp. AJA248-18]